jgi:GNAT superfamily N-acetyltransferase
MASYEWRGNVTSAELNQLHADAFGTSLYTDQGWPWSELLARHSLGWVTARDGGRLLGFVNVIWDGLVHAWLQDTMVDSTARHGGIGRRLVAVAQQQAAMAGCEWLHVDFDDDLRPFYIDTCGFAPATAGVVALHDVGT